MVDIKDSKMIKVKDTGILFFYLVKTDIWRIQQNRLLFIKNHCYILTKQYTNKLQKQQKV